MRFLALLFGLCVFHSLSLCTIISLYGWRLTVRQRYHGLCMYVGIPIAWFLFPSIPKNPYRGRVHFSAILRAFS
jgi:hypothetical protein